MTSSRVRATRRALLAPLVAAACLAPALAAEDLGGGRPASHGRVVRFVMSHWIPGEPSSLGLVDPPVLPISYVAILSPARTSLVLPGIGTLIADATHPAALMLPLSGTLPLPPLPLALNGTTLYVQGAVLDPGLAAGVVLTDATKVDLFQPVVLVGNQRQTANSISVVDLRTRQVVQTLTNSENGSIAFSPDRRFAYVCEPGSLRNQVVVYDLTQSPIVVATTIPVSGGIRYRGCMQRDGRRLYVPLHNAISVIDADRTSTTFHTEIGTIPVPITGSPTSIFTGPIDLAVTPDNAKLYIAYGEQAVTFPGTCTLGVVDLNLPGRPHRSIPITVGGVVTLLNNLATHNRVEMSPDGLWVYVQEYGFTPGQFSLGFVNGGVVKVVSTLADTEFAAIPSGGYGQNDFFVDRMGRALWSVHLNAGRMGELLRIDVDRHSPTRFTVLYRVPVHAVPFNGGYPAGVATTPDGATVCVSVVEDGSHPVPELLTFDAATGVLYGQPIPVQSLPATVGIPRY